jgi:3-hydroxyacyl-CoA dehydrogenase
MLQAALEETAKHYEGLVIGNQGKHFCVGANLMLVLMEAQDHNWLEIELMIRRFQEASTAIKYSPKPVVAAPFGMTLGGGTELVLPAARIQAAAETYMGLVEAGVGLIPAGGGTKELMLCLQALFPEEIKHEQQEILKACFERIALAKVSGSAAEARMLGFLSQKDGITMNQSYLLFEAKQAVLNLAKAHYVAPQPAKVEVSGCSGKAVLTLAAHHYRESGYASAHDFTIASKLAHVLSGGDIPMGSKVTEQYLLDLEREAFLSLCGEPKTQARIAYMLRKGKPLRN